MNSYKGELNGDGIPPYSALPLQKEVPYLNAWGLYGENDQLGTLNRLNEEHSLSERLAIILLQKIIQLVVNSAKNEIKTGVRVALDAPLNAQTKSGKAFFGREIFHQDIIHKTPRCVNDDIWTFNSQVSTQWDGLRHYAYQKEGLFYGGVRVEEIHGQGYEARKGNGTGSQVGRTISRDPEPEVLGIHSMAEKGIVGRAILLDFHSWRLAQTPPILYYSFKQGSIPLKYLLAVAQSQGTEIRFGDILFIRTGYTASLNAMDAQELSNLKDVLPPSFSGVEQSEEVVEWIWNNFSAVAGDQPSFECWPSQNPKLLLHEVLIAGWGMPIGELFDLERLAEHCKEVGRWSFFLSSQVCNVVGGVASPPNALAIF